MRTLALEIFDPTSSVANLVTAMEPKLERAVERKLGSPVGIAIHSSRTISKNREKPGRCDALVAKLGKSMRADRIDSFADYLLQGNCASALVVTVPDVFNHPRFQERIFSYADPSLISFLIEPEAGGKEWEGRLHEVLAQLLASSACPASETKAEDARRIEARKRVHPPYLRASQPIRNEKSGRLDAGKIRRFFGLSLREFAGILKLPNHQRIVKTPDALSLQEKLQPFEEILRGRLLVDEDDALFRQWLNTPSKEFPLHEGNRLSPMDFIRQGHPEVVAGLVHDELTGHPS